MTDPQDGPEALCARARRMAQLDPSRAILALTEAIEILGAQNRQILEAVTAAVTAVGTPEPRSAAAEVVHLTLAGTDHS